MYYNNRDLIIGWISKLLKKIKYYNKKSMCNLITTHMGQTVQAFIWLFSLVT